MPGKASNTMEFCKRVRPEPADDGPDGLNEAAFERALIGGRKRTRKPALDCEAKALAQRTAAAFRGEVACDGCASGYPIRACSFTGEPWHRGPDHSFRCSTPEHKAVR